MDRSAEERHPQGPDYRLRRTTINVKQGKHGAGVKIRTGKPLKDVLHGMLQTCGQHDGKVVATSLLANFRNQPWTSSGFDTVWRRALTKANIENLTFHDIRGTAVKRFAITGYSTPQIASIAEHSLRDVETILDAHYPGGKVELADQAMTKLEAFEEYEK